MSGKPQPSTDALKRELRDHLMAGGNAKSFAMERNLSRSYTSDLAYKLGFRRHFLIGNEPQVIAALRRLKPKLDGLAK